MAQNGWYVYTQSCVLYRLLYGTLHCCIPLQKKIFLSNISIALIEKDESCVALRYIFIVRHVGIDKGSKMFTHNMKCTI